MPPPDESPGSDVSSDVPVIPVGGSTVESVHANAWYYLFSAVPQTFAAAYALMFGVALYRLQQIEHVIARVATDVEAFFARIKAQDEYRASCAPLAAVNNWSAYVDAPKRVTVDEQIQRKFGSHEAPDRAVEFLAARTAEIDRQLGTAQIVWSHLYRSLTLTGILIGVTTILIPLGMYVRGMGLCCGWVAVGSLTLFTLRRYFKLVVALLPLGTQRSRP